MLKWCASFGVPKAFTSDDGTYFNGQVMQMMSSRLGAWFTILTWRMFRGRMGRWNR